MINFCAFSRQPLRFIGKRIKWLLSLVLICLLPLMVSAQPEEILIAKKVSRKITFGFHPSDLVNSAWEMRYAIDEDFQWKDSKRFKGIVALSAPDEFNVLTTFINPLAYRVTISESKSEDQASKATEDFLEKLVHLFPQAATSQAPQSGASLTTVTTPTQLANALKQIDNMTISGLEKEKLKINYIAGSSVAVGANAKQKYLSNIRSPELLNLLLWVQTFAANNKTSVFPCLKEIKQVETLSSMCAKVERQFYAFPEQINQTVAAMRAPITHDELQAAMPDIIERTKQLRTALDSTQIYLNRLQYISENGLMLGDSIVDAKGDIRKTLPKYSKLISNPDSVAKKALRTTCGLLQNHVRFTISTYVQSALEKQKVREELYASMLPLIEALRQAVTAEGYDNSDKKRFLHQGSVESERGVVKDITRTYAKRKVGWASSRRI